MMKFIVALFITSTLVASWGTPPQENIKINLQVEPKSIEAGRSAVLTWKVENASSVLISGIGRVGAEGHQLVNPLSTTKYTLIAESPYEVSSKTVSLTVTGGRGGDEFPQDYSLFKYPVSYRQPTVSLVTFLDQIHSILQNDMTFSVRGPQNEGSRYLFITNRSERGYLMQSDDNQNRIGRRRISYIVEVEPVGSDGKTVAYTIKTLIEYKRMIEATWRVESNEGIYRTEANRLQGMIDRLR